MSGRTYWLSILVVLVGAFAGWYTVAYWSGTTDPVGAAAIGTVISLTNYLLVLGWLLSPNKKEGCRGERKPSNAV